MASCPPHTTLVDTFTTADKVKWSACEDLQTPAGELVLVPYPYQGESHASQQTAAIMDLRHHRKFAQAPPTLAPVHLLTSRALSHVLTHAERTHRAPTELTLTREVEVSRRCRCRNSSR